MQAVKAYYQKLGSVQYNFNEALDALVTLTDRSQKTVHSKHQKKFLVVSGSGGPTEKNSQLVDHFIRPLVPLSKSYIRDSVHLINILNKFIV